MQKLPTALGMVVAAMAALLFHCGRTADGGDSDAGSTSTGTVDSASPQPLADAGAGLDGASTHDASDALDASTLPDVSCADDAASCEFIPASTCADMKTLLYFSDGTCTGGTCTWTTKSMTCGPQSQCVNGGCTPPTTK